MPIAYTQVFMGIFNSMRMMLSPSFLNSILGLDHLQPTYSNAIWMSCVSCKAFDTKSGICLQPHTILPLTLPQYICLTRCNTISFTPYLLEMSSLISLCFSFKLHSNFNHITTILPPSVFNLFGKPKKFWFSHFRLFKPHHRHHPCCPILCPWHRREPFFI